MTNLINLALVGLDFETTGVDVENDRIVTGAVVRDVPESHVQPADVTAWTWLADPGIEIPQGATDVHGISTAQAQLDGRPIVTVLLEIRDRLVAELRAPAHSGQWRPLVIYNAPYDLTIFDRECRRHGLETLHEVAQREGWPVVPFDPLVIDKARNKYVKGKGQRQLTPTCRRYGIELSDAHDALADVRASIALARAIMIKEPRLANADAEQLLSWQRRWHASQAAEFSNYLLRIAAGKSGEDRAELETKAMGVRSEIGHWPMRPLPERASL
jgi:DNA polymerase-3 subunit epsilon